MSAKKPMSLGEFLAEDMARRKMTMREYAAWLGVSHSTIGNHINGRSRGVREPFLARLSEKTGVSMVTLRALADQGFAEQVGLSARALLLAERFDKLPESVQDFILRSVLGE
jgi:plasmid maintenance system antidote protein VapI